MKLFFFRKCSYLQIHLFFVGFVVVLFSGCGTPFSLRSQCYENNKCSTIEGKCFLDNLSIYQVGTGSAEIGNTDFAILAGTCLGLEATCRKNCESSTLF